MEVEIELSTRSLWIQITIQVGDDLTGEVRLGPLLRKANENRAIFLFAVLLNRRVFQIGSKPADRRFALELQNNGRAAGEVDAPVDAVSQKQTETDKDPDQRE